MDIVVINRTNVEDLLWALKTYLISCPNCFDIVYNEAQGNVKNKETKFSIFLTNPYKLISFSVFHINYFKLIF